MRCLIISLESFQRGDVPPEVQKYILSQHGNIFQILDESSKIKTNEPCKDSKKSKRTQAVLKLNRIGERCIMTGTFMSKSPVNAYDQMNYLKDGFFPESIYSFAEHYVIRRNLPVQRGARVTLSEDDYMKIRKRLLNAKSKAGGLMGAMDSVCTFYGISRDDCVHIMEHEEYTPFKNLDELWERIGDTCLKVEREESPDIPSKIYQTYDVQLTEEQKKLYLQLQEMHCTDNITVDNGLKLYLRFQDICNGYEPVESEELNDNGQHKVELIPLKVNPKLDLMEEIVESIGDKQIVIWCSRTRLLYDARDRLEAKGYKCGVYDGKNKNREEDYEAFGKGKIQVIFVNQASGGYGLDDFQKADYAMFLCSSYSVEERIQAEGRTRRGEIKEHKYYIDLTCTGTCEDRVVSALKRGQELVSTGTTDVELYKYYGD